MSDIAAQATQPEDDDLIILGHDLFVIPDDISLNYHSKIDHLS